VNVRILLIFLFSLTSGASLAQVLTGPSVGVNYSWITFGDKDYNNYYTVKPVLGYHAGVNLSFRVRKRFFLHSSIIYSTKGKIIEGKVDTDLRNKVINNYIELPILYTVEFKMKLKGNKEYKIYLGAGPNISYWLGGKGTFYNSELHEAFLGPRDYKIVFNKNFNQVNDHEMGVVSPNRLQLGLNLSAGLIFEPIQHREFMLTFRYELGHTYASKSTEGGALADVTLYTDNTQVRNQGFRVSLSYLIDLKTDQRKKGRSTSTIRKGKIGK